MHLVSMSWLEKGGKVSFLFVHMVYEVIWVFGYLLSIMAQRTMSLTVLWVFSDEAIEASRSCHVRSYRFLLLCMVRTSLGFFFGFN